MEIWIVDGSQVEFFFLLRWSGYFIYIDLVPGCLDEEATL